ncbi:hypothetical protein, partial [Rhodovulum sulfidophilum]|uniref:hypothetical protein n=1 Tax=Rhodovulum sulfidophilum TaxID=35806 RepID=UPI001F470D87
TSNVKEHQRQKLDRSAISTWRRPPHNHLCLSDHRVVRPGHRPASASAPPVKRCLRILLEHRKQFFARNCLRQAKINITY